MHNPPGIQQEMSSRELEKLGRDGDRVEKCETISRNAERNAVLENIKGCIKNKDINKGSRIHANLITKGLLHKDLYINNALINMYAKCGALSKAEELFDELPKRNIASWNSLISGYVQQGRGDEALSRFKQMKSEDASPNAITFTCLLKACGSIQSLENGEEIHAEVYKQGLLEGNFVLGTAVVDMYVKCGALDKAMKVLDELPTRNAATWNAIIGGYAHHGLGYEALNFFQRMQDEGFSPNEITFVCILKACGSTRSIKKGEEIEAEVRRQGLLGKSIILGNALVDMYAKCGMLTKANEVFDKLPMRNIVTWNSLINGYLLHGFANEALNCYDRMRDEGLSPGTVTFACILKACGDKGSGFKGEEIHAEISKQGLLPKSIVIGTALIDMYAKCGMLAKARKVFDELTMRDVISWNAMISGYSKHDLAEEALYCFNQMLDDGFLPDGVTYACVLKACGGIGSAEKGEEIHEKMRKQGLLQENIMLCTALVDMYARCGLFAKAQEVFDELSEQDIVLWNALISGYAQCGQVRKAAFLFNQMRAKGVIPDAVTFLVMLMACSHAGLVKDGQIYFNTMNHVYLLNPTLQHYSCMVDLFSRSGYFDKAINVIERVPPCDRLQVWMALLGACRNWANVELGRFAFDQSMQLDETHDAAYVCMSNTYAAAGMRDEATMDATVLRMRMGAAKIPLIEAM